MQSLGRRYVQYINTTYRRRGTLWEGRHKVSQVDAESYLLTCKRDIELNPVRANRVSHPADYRWSSHACNAQGAASSFITPHACYLALAADTLERQHHYRALFANQLESRDIHAIRQAAHYGIALGSKRFKEQIEAALGRSMGYAKRDRPGIKEEAPAYC